MAKPRCFVGSSSEAIAIAHAVHESLELVAEVTVWDQDVFQLSETAVDSLTRLLDSVDFAVFIFSADDVLKLRGVEHAALRDNVILELGLAVGKLGRRRTFMLVPRNSPDLRIPTDLAGLTPATYDTERSDKNIVAAVGPACAKITRLIERMGRREATSETSIENPRSLVTRGLRHVAQVLADAYGPAGSTVSIEAEGRQIITRVARDSQKVIERRASKR